MRSKSRARSPISSAPRRLARASRSPSRMRLATARTRSSRRTTVCPSAKATRPPRMSAAARASRKIVLASWPRTWSRAVEVVVQLEHRVRSGPDGVADLGVVVLARTDLAVAAGPAVDRRGPRGRGVAGRDDPRVPVELVPGDADPREVRAGLLEAGDPLLHQLGIREVGDLEAVLPRGGDGGELAAGRALVGRADRSRRDLHEDACEQQDATEDEHDDPRQETSERVQSAHWPFIRPRRVSL